ncbi:DUF7350 domain-containing protein [Halovenus salina]|uniref:DUF7350 domain-containing protein n=1 Tax=Halovenus salina TaxID=1510225 RepID=A0ABD5W6D5_9EURY|nr:hypothetical protein [Halovenus salina]
MTGDDTPVDLTHSPSRRRLLAATVGTMTTGLAGCLGGDESTDDEPTATPEPPEVTDAENVPQRPRVSDPPEAVYLPTHRASMTGLDTVESGPYTVSPMLSYPHRFWLISGSETELVRPNVQGLHLMFSVQDSETGTVLPVDVGSQVRILRDGEVSETLSPWPMISQTMGFHFGDNIPIREQGSYTVEIDLSPMTVRRTGDFDGRFESRQTVSFEFEFDSEFQRDIVDGVDFLDESRWGEPGALEPMMMGHGNGSEMNGGTAVQRPEAYPGRSLGDPTSGDARFVARYLTDSRLGEDGYLLVSPRTPYNRIPLADMALSVSGAIEGELVQTLDSEVGHHYGLADSLSPEDSLELTVEGPPQVARHQGYETAFLDMPSMTLEVSE